MAPFAETAEATEGVEATEAADARDRRLLRLLLALTDPDDVTARRRAAEALGQADDARAAAPLRRSLATDEQTVQEAAIRALASFRGGAVEGALERVLRDGRRPASLRVAAAESLGAQATDSAAEILWRARESQNDEVVAAAERTLSEAYAARYERWLAERPQRAHRPGLLLLSAAMAFHGGLWMTGLASVAGGDPGLLSFAGGAVVGGVAPYLLTLDSSLSLAHGAWLASTPTWGVGAGALLGGALMLDQDGVTWSALAGQTLGLGLGLLTYDVLPYDPTQIALINLSGLAGLLAAGGVLVLHKPTGTGAAPTVLEVGLGTGLAVGLLGTPYLRVEPNDYALIAEASFVGGWLGGWMPALLFGENRREAQTGSGVLLGAALGFFGGTGLTQFLDIPGARYLPPAIGMAYGSALGGGAAWLADDALSLRAQTGLLLAGGALGAAGGVLLGDDEPPTRGGIALHLVTDGWGLWQGMGFAAALDAGRRETSGAALVGLGAGGAVGSVLQLAIAPQPAKVGVAAAGGAWGGWLSGWAAHVLRKGNERIDGDDVLLATLVGSDVGLLLGVLAVSPLLDVPEARLGWINLGGVMGMGIGTSLAAVFSDRVAEGNLAGSAIGLLAAGIVTAGYDFEPNARQEEGRHATLLHLQDLTPGLATVPAPDGSLDTLITLSGRFDL